MTNVQHKLIQDVKDLKERTKKLEGYNEILFCDTGRLESIYKSLSTLYEDKNFMEMDIDRTKDNIIDLQNNNHLLTKLTLVTATLSFITFMMLVLTLINL